MLFVSSLQLQCSFFCPAHITQLCFAYYVSQLQWLHLTGPWKTHPHITCYKTSPIASSGCFYFVFHITPVQLCWLLGVVFCLFCSINNFICVFTWLDFYKISEQLSQHLSILLFLQYQLLLLCLYYCRFSPNSNLAKLITCLFCNATWYGFSMLLEEKYCWCLYLVHHDYCSWYEWLRKLTKC